MKNYIEEIDSNDQINAVIVCALKHMLLYGEDFLNDLQMKNENPWGKNTVFIVDSQFLIHHLL